MKNLIRKWLGIENCNQEIFHLKEAIRDRMSDQHLRRYAGEAFIQVLKGEPDTPWPFSKTEHNLFQAILRDKIEEANERNRSTTLEAALKAVADRICSEAFIDEVIERIKRKQLK